MWRVPPAELPPAKRRHESLDRYLLTAYPSTSPVTFTPNLYTERFPQQTGDFHAVSLDLIATYAPDRVGEDEVWLGAQLSFHLNGLSSPPPVSGGTRVGSYGQYRAPEPGQSTDCNGGHLP